MYIQFMQTVLIKLNLYCVYVCINDIKTNDILLISDSRLIQFAKLNGKLLILRITLNTKITWSFSNEVQLAKLRSMLKGCCAPHREHRVYRRANTRSWPEIV